MMLTRSASAYFDADALSRAQRNRAFEFTAAIVMLAVLLIAATAFVGWLYDADLRWAIALWCVSAGILSGLILTVGVVRAWGSISGVERDRRRILDHEYPVITAAPLPEPTLPNPTAALPPGDETIKTTINGRAGEIARETVHGFEPDDLKWLCKYLATGGSWTEAVMENIPLPYSGEKMGKAQGQTPYNRCFGTEPQGLMLRAGIIEGRGGPGNNKGKLVIKDAAEMYQRIKALPADAETH